METTIVYKKVVEIPVVVNILKTRNVKKGKRAMLKHRNSPIVDLIHSKIFKRNRSLRFDGSHVHTHKVEVAQK